MHPSLNCLSQERQSQLQPTQVFPESHKESSKRAKNPRRCREEIEQIAVDQSTTLAQPPTQCSEVGQRIQAQPLVASLQQTERGDSRRVTATRCWLVVILDP